MLGLWTDKPLLTADLDFLKSLWEENQIHMTPGLEHRVVQVCQAEQDIVPNIIEEASGREKTTTKTLYIHKHVYRTLNRDCDLSVNTEISPYHTKFRNCLVTIQISSSYSISNLLKYSLLMGNLKHIYAVHISNLSEKVLMLKL